MSSGRRRSRSPDNTLRRSPSASGARPPSPAPCSIGRTSTLACRWPERWGRAVLERGAGSFGGRAPSPRTRRCGSASAGSGGSGPGCAKGAPARRPSPRSAVMRARSLVSIVIPAFNAERWLAHAVKSALDQTWPWTEIVVVNDGSRDGTRAAAASFHSATVRVIDQANRGAAAARNRGFLESRGEFIQYLDADDL